MTLCALLVYSNSFHAPLIFDNDEIIVKDQRVHSTSALQLHRILAGQYWETAPTGLYRPLTTLSYLLNYAILGNGSDPAGYHWLNFFIHAANMALVYALGAAIFAETPAAILLALVWGLHPVNTEAVTNIVGRGDLLAAMGVLAALHSHRRATGKEGMHRLLWFAGVLVGAAVGIFSKESGIVLIAVLLAYDLTLSRGLWRWRTISYSLALIPVAAYLWIRASVLASGPYLYTAFTDNPLLGASFWTSRATALKVVLRYLALLVWPANLSYDYSYNQVPLFSWRFVSWQDLQAVLGLLVCVGALVAALRWYRRLPVVSFGILFFFVAFAPVSNIFLLIGTIMGERLLYLPAIGFVVIIAIGLQVLRRRIPSGAWTAAVALLVITYGARTWARNNEWLDQQRMWLSAAAASPDSYKSNINAATSTFFFVNAQDWARALQQTDRAMRILDPLPDALNASNPYRQAGIFYRALGEQLAAGRINGVGTGSPDAWYRRSLAALLRGERIDRTMDRRYREENGRRGIPGLTSTTASIYLELGRTYLRLQDSRHALEAFERGRRLQSDPQLLEEAAVAYQAAGDARNAALALVEAMAVDPSRTRLASQLLGLYRQTDPNGCAISRDPSGDSLNTACPMVHNDICAASRNVAVSYNHHGQAQEAAEIRRVATTELGCDASQLR